MQRKIFKYIPTNIELFKQKLLAWANTFTHVSFLESNTQLQNKKNATNHNKYNCIVAVGALDFVCGNQTNSFE